MSGVKKKLKRHLDTLRNNHQGYYLVPCQAHQWLRCQDHYGVKLFKHWRKILAGIKSNLSHRCLWSPEVASSASRPNWKILQMNAAQLSHKVSYWSPTSSMERHHRKIGLQMLDPLGMMDIWTGCQTGPVWGFKGPQCRRQENLSSFQV